MNRQLLPRKMRRPQHVTQCDAPRRSVTRDRQACCGGRSGKRGGGLNPLVLAWRGPHRAFVIKISKLNTKSPRGAREGGVVKSPAIYGADRAPTPHFSPRNSGKHFFMQLDASAHLASSRRRTELEGGGGLKSLRPRGRRPRWSSCADFFSALEVLNIQTRIRPIQTAAQVLGFTAVRSSDAASSRPRHAQIVDLFSGADRSASAEKLPRNSGWGGSSDARELR
jgi:hypothetical protein